MLPPFECNLEKRFKNEQKANYEDIPAIVFVNAIEFNRAIGFVVR